jgi:hypothetical protein
MSQQITLNFGVIRENSFKVLEFSENFDFGAKFHNEVQ